MYNIMEFWKSIGQKFLELKGLDIIGFGDLTRADISSIFWLYHHVKIYLFINNCEKTWRQ